MITVFSSVMRGDPKTAERQRLVTSDNTVVGKYFLPDEEDDV